MSLIVLFAANALSAVATHVWFRNHEASSASLALVVLSLIPSPFIYLFIPHVSSLPLATALAYTIYLVTLATSIVAYRLSPYHPLAKYPGPIICKVTKLWGVYIALGGKTHLYHKSLHDKYGSIIRIGPNELSMADKESVPLVLGGQGMPKGPLWDGRRFGQAGGEYDSIIDVRDMQIHAQLRKPWNKSFSPGPLKDYEALLVPRAYQLIQELERVCAAEPGGVGRADMAKWVSFFAFDFMGDMAFGGCFELMRDGDKNGFWHNMEGGLFLPSITQHIPWFAKLLRGFPVVGNGMRAFVEFGVAEAQKRASLELKKKDFFYHLIESSTDASASPESMLGLIVSNALLTIVAGSDTTASVLSNIIYYLISNPHDFARLRDEIDHAYPVADVDHITTDNLASLNFLNAVINEALRLQPAVPTSLQRAPPKGSGGKLLGSIFIPEGTAVQVPPYVLQRDPRYFSPHPDKFWPERWLVPEGGDVVLDRAAFIPFSHGPANCAGRPLAMTEMRYVIALLVKRFTITFVDGYDPAQWERDLSDRFVFAKGELPVKLMLREKS